MASFPPSRTPLACTECGSRFFLQDEDQDMKVCSSCGATQTQTLLEVSEEVFETQQVKGVQFLQQEEDYAGRTSLSALEQMKKRLDEETSPDVHRQVQAAASQWSGDHHLTSWMLATFLWKEILRTAAGEPRAWWRRATKRGEERLNLVTLNRHGRSLWLAFFEASRPQPYHTSYEMRTEKEWYHLAWSQHERDLIKKAMLQDSQELHAEARAQAQVVVHDGDEAEVDGHVKLKERVKEIRETNRYRLTLSGPMVLALLYLAVNNCGVKPFLLGDLLRAAADGWLRPLICRIETLHADQYILYSNQSRPVQKPIVFPEVAVCLDELEARQFPCVRLAPQQLLRRFGENIGRAEQDVMLVANFVCRIAIDLEMWPKCSYEDKMDLMIVLLTSPSSVLFAELVALVSVLAAVWILERKVPNAKRKRRKSPKAQKEEKEEGMEKETNGRQNDAKKERNAQKDTKVGKDEDKKDKTKQKMKEQKNDAEKAKVVKKAKAKEAKAKVEIKEEAHEAEEHGSNTHLAAPVCAPKAGHEAPHEAVRPRPCAGPFMRTVQDLMHRGFQPLETSEATGEATGEATADFEDPEDFDPENPWIHWRREGIWSASDLRAVHQHYSASLQFQPWNLLRLRVLAEQGTWFWWGQVGRPLIRTSAIRAGPIELVAFPTTEGSAILESNGCLGTMRCGKGMLEFVITQSCRLGFVTWEEAERHEHCSWVLKGSSAPVRGREETFVETQLHVFKGFLNKNFMDELGRKPRGKSTRRAKTDGVLSGDAKVRELVRQRAKAKLWCQTFCSHKPPEKEMKVTCFKFGLFV
ncbi:unnamed protein product [Durusdinium trenchii]|uniref:Uncharacterized protein n=1 Tax=Durusdinium trenchii TaxID=1381693 RepID=A0ABP0QDQ5_9DINO